MRKQFSLMANIIEKEVPCRLQEIAFNTLCLACLEKDHFLYWRDCCRHNKNYMLRAQVPCRLCFKGTFEDQMCMTESSGTLHSGGGTCRYRIFANVPILVIADMPIFSNERNSYLLWKNCQA